MTDAVTQMNEANAALADWVQTLPVSLIVPGCEMHAKVQVAMKAADAEIRRLANESERLREAAEYARVMIDHFVHGEHGQDGLVAGYDRLRAALAQVDTHRMAETPKEVRGEA